MIVGKLVCGCTLVCCVSGLLLMSGAFVNGPYGLIATAVSADLGTHDTLRGSTKALAKVTSIIEGTGSMGRIYKFFFCSIQL